MNGKIRMQTHITDITGGSASDETEHNREESTEQPTSDAFMLISWKDLHATRRDLRTHPDIC